MLIEFLNHSQSFFLTTIGILGLAIGSFLNVVIIRLPKMLHKEWTTQCISYLQENSTAFSPPATDTQNIVPFNLLTPRSHCPHCKHPIGILENIPIISFLILKGRCRVCHHPISWRYPMIELLTAICSMIIAIHFGVSWAMLFALMLTWSLIVLAGIDLDHQLLPDDIVLPMLWLGLVLNIQQSFNDLTSAMIGAIAGYLFLWTVNGLFKLIMHKEGMGHGDFKLLAMLGAWLGWQALPNIILLSSMTGAVVGIILILFKRHSRAHPLPFGPFLAMAGWVSLIWGNKIADIYFKFAGIS